jgi:hypothetical protein
MPSPQTLAHSWGLWSTALLAAIDSHTQITWPQLVRLPALYHPRLVRYCLKDLRDVAKWVAILVLCHAVVMALGAAGLLRYHWNCLQPELLYMDKYSNY